MATAGQPPAFAAIGSALGEVGGYVVDALGVGRLNMGMFIRLGAAAAVFSLVGYVMLALAGAEPTLVHQEEARSYQLLLGMIAGLVSLGIAVFSWWAKSIMAKMCKIEEAAERGNSVVVSMLREIGEIKVVQTFTTEAIRELKADFTKRVAL